MSEPALTFLPWVGRGGTFALPPDLRDSHPASRVSSTAEVMLNGTAPAGIKVQLMGPGDVTGLVLQQVIRTEPARDALTFESNYLAAIEFDEPALPWLFTPASASASRLRPWLCLVVVKVGPGIRLDVPGKGALPVLRVGPPALPEDELPDLADSWAWAHGQVATGQAGAEAIAEALRGDPARNLSRLICLRLLAAQTEYLACLVPTFEAGRLAGLGEEPGDAQGPAWQHAQGMPPVELPVYYHWRFATGPAGDFQSLALAIRGRVPETGFGSRQIDLSNAGVGLADTADAHVRLGGALRPIDTAPAAWSDAALAPRFAAAFTEILNAPDHAPAIRPLLAPPRYGAAYRPVATLGAAGATGWYEQLNTHPANRMAAALGVRIIQRDQEVLVASAWDQAADMRAARALGRLTEAGIAVAQRFHQRHLVPLAPGAGIFVAAPLLRRLARDFPRADPAIAAMLDGGLSARGFSPTVRRMTRVHGPALRRARREPASPAGVALAARFSTLAAAHSAHVADIPDVFEVLGASALEGAWDLVRPEAFAGAPRRPFFAIRPLDLQGSGPRSDIFDRATLDAETSTGEHEDIEPDGPRPRPRPRPRRDSRQAATFRVLARDHLTSFLAPPNAGGGQAFQAIDLGAAFNRIMDMAAPRATFAAALGNVLSAGGPAPDPADPTPAPEIPTDLSPRFTAPMARALAELGQEWVLPGLEGVPANTALALVTNSSFVQAFMIGLNHEFGRELLWREFPAPLDATFFQRFWDSAVDPDAPPDLEPLADRGDRALDDDATPGDQLVLLLRSELLRRFPDAMVSATNGADILPPVFTGAMVPDVRYFGFAIPENEADEWSIVIAEQPSAPRFGFDVGGAPEDVTHAPAPDETSAALADRLRQFPARITIPVRVLMRKPTP